MTDKPPAGGLPPDHLEELFTPPARRSANLTRILSPVRPVAPTEPAEPIGAEDDDNNTVAEPIEPARTPASTRTEAADPAVTPAPEPERPSASKASTGGRRLIIVYMPASQREWLRRAAVGATQLDVVLDAVEQAEMAGELSQAIADAYQPETGGLFERPRASRGSRAHVQVSLSMLQSHVEVLDRLVAQHGAPDRSALVRAALDHARTHSRKHA